MESLVNKRVRLQKRYTKTYLVACNDKESVKSLTLENNKPKPENSVWVINKSKKPDKSVVRLESVYGKFLGSWSKGTICQVDKKAEGCCTWWTLEDVDNSGFTCVLIGIRGDDRAGYILDRPDDPGVMVGKIIYPRWWYTWFGPERLFQWELEIVETPPPAPTPTPTPKTPTVGEEDQTIRVPTFVDGIPTSGCIYQVHQMNIRNIIRKSEGTPVNLSPFNNYDVNTGRNINESGTQIVGGVNIQTQIDNLVNNTIVRRDA